MSSTSTVIAPYQPQRVYAERGFCGRLFLNCVLVMTNTVGVMHFVHGDYEMAILAVFTFNLCPMGAMMDM